MLSPQQDFNEHQDNYVDPNAKIDPPILKDDLAHEIHAIEENSFYLASVNFLHANNHIKGMEVVFSNNDKTDQIYNSEQVSENPAKAIAAFLANQNTFAGIQTELKNTDHNKSVVCFYNIEDPASLLDKLHQTLQKEAQPHYNIEAASALSQEKLSILQERISEIEETQSRYNQEGVDIA